MKTLTPKQAVEQYPMDTRKIAVRRTIHIWKQPHPVLPDAHYVFEIMAFQTADLVGFRLNNGHLFIPMYNLN